RGGGGGGEKNGAKARAGGERGGPPKKTRGRGEGRGGEIPPKKASNANPRRANEDIRVGEVGADNGGQQEGRLAGRETRVEDNGLGERTMRKTLRSLS